MQCGGASAAGDRDFRFLAALRILFSKSQQKIDLKLADAEPPSSHPAVTQDTRAQPARGAHLGSRHRRKYVRFYARLTLPYCVVCHIAMRPG